MNAEQVTNDITKGLTLISALQPDIAIALTAYNILKGIWLTTNPGKTEADFVSYLGTSSKSNVDDTAAYLTAQGYVQTSPGNWSKPQPAATAAPAG